MPFYAPVLEATFFNVFFEQPQPFFRAPSMAVHGGPPGWHEPRVLVLISFPKPHTEKVGKFH